MGYACPVCEVPQRDAEHLANHLAFTAMTHGGDHEAWLDDVASGWAAGGPAELAPVVAEHAPAADYDEVFEDTVDGGHDHSHPPGAEVSDAAGPSGAVGPPDAAGRAGATPGPEVESVLGEAREMLGAADGEADDEPRGSEAEGAAERAGGSAADGASEAAGTSGSDGTREGDGTAAGGDAAPDGAPGAETPDGGGDGHGDGDADERA